MDGDAQELSELLLLRRLLAVAESRCIIYIPLNNLNGEPLGPRAAYVFTRRLETLQNYGRWCAESWWNLISPERVSEITGIDIGLKKCWILCLKID